MKMNYVMTFVFICLQLINVHSGKITGNVYRLVESIWYFRNYLWLNILQESFSYFLRARIINFIFTIQNINGIGQNGSSLQRKFISFKQITICIRKGNLFRNEAILIMPSCSACRTSVLSHAGTLHPRFEPHHQIVREWNSSPAMLAAKR